MNTPLTEREEQLLTLAALGELMPDEQQEWERCLAARPELRKICREWRDVTSRLAVAALPMPPLVVERLEAARQLNGMSHPMPVAPRHPRPLWRSFVRVALPLAALVAFGFFVLHESPPATEQEVRSGPVTFPLQQVQWIAPAQETRLLQPAIVWKGTPGHAYDLEITDNATGNVLARATEVQSPWLVETPLTAGMAVTVTLAETGKESTATLSFHVHPDAKPLQADMFSQMKALAEEGHKSDALMLLFRLPEDALTPDEYAGWKRRLSP